MPRSKVELFAATRQGSPFLGVALTAEQAAWVRAAAWRNFHRKTYADTPAFYALCACQYGSCGHCGSGQHRRCAHNDRPAHESPAAYLTDPQGHALAPVYEAGHRHAWTCACRAAAHHQPEQMPLF
jgi:hypothetical protein